MRSSGVGASSTAFQAARDFWFTKSALFSSPSRAGGQAAAAETLHELDAVTAQDVIGDSASPGLASTADAVFRDEGEYWHVGYEGTAVGIRGVKGLFYLQYLLQHPEEKIHVSNLAALGDHYWSPAQVGAPIATIGPQAGVGQMVLGDSGHVLDRRATQEYKARLIDLRAELDEATQWADLERADAIRREIQFLTDQLTAAYGRNGRARKIGDPMERVRKAVTNRIRDAIERISKQHASLGRHLVNTVRTGFYCCYSPENPVEWKS